MFQRCLARLFIALLLAGAAGPAAAGAAAETVLASGGQAGGPVVIAPGAGERVREAAADLAAMLGRITGASFTVSEGDGLTGLAVGVFDDFPALDLAGYFAPESLARREEYLLRTHRQGAWLIGATELAVEHAVWDFLHQLGYRFFFPTDTWEVVPRLPELRLSLDVFERPDFLNRMGPRGAPGGDRDAWRRWRARNRVTPAFTLRTGHVYGGIIRRNRRAFEENPEFLALRSGERGGSKFCIANPGLRALVVADAIARTGPDDDSISMDPSDGGGWCECEPCAEMGSVSDRVVLLANEVAEAINALGLGEKYVGIYAYSMHSPPPAVEVHPNVIVSIATGFIRGGYTIEELVEGWSERAGLIGIRDYHDVYTWSRALPTTRARGGRVDYLVERIPWYYHAGARFMNSEASDSWGANGLGFWLSARLLWDVSAAGRVEELIDDFVSRAFGEARGPMREFYRLIAEERGKPRSNEDLLARLYRRLEEARGLSADPAVRARLDELVLYTRYMELMFALNAASGRQASLAAAAELYRHSYRMRDTLLIPIRSAYRNLRRRGIAVPGEVNPHPFRLGQPAVVHRPWTCDAPFEEAEVERLLREGIAANQVTELEFEPVSFSDDLVPAAGPLGLDPVERGRFGRSDPAVFRRENTLHTWFAAAGEELALTAAGGIVYRNRGDVEFALYSPKEVFGEPVAVAGVPPDREEHPVVLTSPFSGHHQLTWSDGDGRTRLDWPENRPMTMRSCFEEPARLGNTRWSLYFYVPRGTAVVAGFTTGNRGTMLDGAGETVFDFATLEAARGYFAVPVPAGSDGALWRFHNSYGERRLMTVPPWLARNGQEMLLPREVVAADRREAADE